MKVFLLALFFWNAEGDFKIGTGGAYDDPRTCTQAAKQVAKENLLPGWAWDFECVEFEMKAIQGS